MAEILYGEPASNEIREKIKNETEELFNKFGRKPGLACIIVGEDPASLVYVRNKEKTAFKMGFNSKVVRLPLSTLESTLISQINEFNNNPEINGILVQFPLPKHINEKNIIQSINPTKDVDVFHPINIGNLWNGDGDLFPCTPFGVITLLKHYKIILSSRNVCIIGRSNIVGKPLAGLFLRENATVTICHSKTRDLDKIASSSDILVTALGKPQFVTQNFIKKDAIIIDVGINRLPNGKLVGDIDFESIKDIAKAITPVPGGIGPMTIAMLMYNTLKLFKISNSIS